MTKGVGGSTIERELAGVTPATPPPAIAVAEREQRIEKARALMGREKADALIVSAGASLRYFTGVSWGASERFVAMILFQEGAPVFICPHFELGSLEASLAIGGAARTWEEDEDPYLLAAAALRERSAGRVALDPELPFWMAERLRKASSAEFISGEAVIHGCRMQKSQAELALMKHAKSITLDVQSRAARILQAGVSTAEVRRFIDMAHRAHGAGGSSFCIVLFGEATSYPHGVPGEQTLKEGDVVLIDTGCTIEGYNSDITRTYVFGEPNAEQRSIWALEHEAQEAAFAAARPGAPCASVDAAARRVLESAGLGPDYRLPGLPHRTGHGIGLSVHEPPYLVRGDATPLAPGMCFSNEPMIVVPGAFGVRLEDHFYMTENGPAWFTEPSPSIDSPFA